jgi:hypothetical protein
MSNHARPLVILKDMGPCRFDRQTMSFAGEPVEQAKCLMRGMGATRNVVIAASRASCAATRNQRLGGSKASPPNVAILLERRPVKITHAAAAPNNSNTMLPDIAGDF